MTFGLSETIKQNFAPKIVKDFYFLLVIWKNILTKMFVVMTIF